MDEFDILLNLIIINTMPLIIILVLKYIVVRKQNGWSYWGDCINNIHTFMVIVLLSVPIGNYLVLFEVLDNTSHEEYDFKKLNDLALSLPLLALMGVFLL